MISRKTGGNIVLDIKGLYKAEHHTKINNIDLLIPIGSITSVECSIETSNLLIDLILGKKIPSKGEIFISNQSNYDFVKDHMINIGIVLDEGFYERMTVEEYLLFFSDLINSNIQHKDVMQKLGLLDIGNRKISSLAYSQKRRLSFARERLKDINLLIFQEPLANIDKDSTKMILENIEEMRSNGTAVLCTSFSYKNALLIGGKIYLLDENGIEEIEQEIPKISEAGRNEINLSLPEIVADIPFYKIEKIPAKIDETILLFNPAEIEYIESENSISYLNVRGERFICSLTLNELEIRLEHLGFFRSHRSYLVNLQRVREMVTWTRNSYSLTLDDKKKSTIPLSKGRIEELKKILNL